MLTTDKTLLSMRKKIRTKAEVDENGKREYAAGDLGSRLPGVLVTVATKGAGRRLAAAVAEAKWRGEGDVLGLPRRFLQRRVGARGFAEIRIGRRG
ncbi:unnamed protein product [Sphenostylis stenocarpa]|uniref:Uncharacterized protein n=1 Tax=Sphenostylis stenocarpa TaxID=92480 RepID=A0AA86S9K2_9FABA|nr:unnamed protein product [Sphenostylis stenocarpa]